VDADNDANASRKAVVNELMARRFFGTAQAAVGGRFALINGAAFEIVGVAANTRDRAIREEPSPLAYATYSQTPTGRGQMTLLVRVAGERHGVAAEVRRLARQIDPAMPLLDVQTLSDRVA